MGRVAGESLGGGSANQGHSQAVTPELGPIDRAGLVVGLDVYTGHGGSQHGRESLDRGQDLPGLDEGQRFFRVRGSGRKDRSSEDRVVPDDGLEVFAGAEVFGQELQNQVGHGTDGGQWTEGVEKTIQPRVEAGNVILVRSHLLSLRRAGPTTTCPAGRICGQADGQRRRASGRSHRRHRRRAA